jgi:hypothetical protein
MPDIGLPPPWQRKSVVYGTLNRLQSSRQVLGADLNRSESRRGAANPMRHPHAKFHPAYVRFGSDRD